MTATATLAEVLTTEPTRARRLARDTGLPQAEVRAALLQLQRDGLARSHDRRWTTRPGGQP